MLVKEGLSSERKPGSRNRIAARILNKLVPINAKPA
jgi:hypothetical protein